MIGTGELIVIFCVILLLFGGKRLPELAKSLGIAIREFKSAFHGIDQPKSPVEDKRIDELDPKE